MNVTRNVSINSGIRFRPYSGDYVLLKIIGRSSSGSLIFLARHKPSQALVNIKYFSVDCDQDYLHKFIDRLLLHRQLRHENVLNFCCSFVHKEHVWTVTPCMLYGSCYDVLQNSHPNGLNESATLIIMTGVLSALSYLHGSSVIHRGISSHQLLIDSNYTVKLAGFQHSVSLLQGGMRQRAIFEIPSLSDARLLYYYSPELLAQRMQGYNTLADIYSLGVLAIELATAKLLLADQHVVAMMYTKCSSGGSYLNVAEKTLTEATYQSEGSNAQSYSPAFINLVLSCLSFNLEDRPPAEELLCDPVIKRYSKKPQSLNQFVQFSPIIQNNERFAELELDSGAHTDMKLSSVVEEASDWNFLEEVSKHTD